MNGLEDVMGAFVGHPINEATLTALLAEVQSATTGTATLLPSDFSDGEVRVQVTFADHAVVATVRSAGLDVVRG